MQLNRGWNRRYQRDTDSNPMSVSDNDHKQKALQPEHRLP